MNDKPITNVAQSAPVAWRVDGKRDGKDQIWFYYKPEWPTMHEEHGDKVTPLYAAPVTEGEQALLSRDWIAGTIFKHMVHPEHDPSNKTYLEDWADSCKAADAIRAKLDDYQPERMRAALTAARDTEGERK